MADFSRGSGYNQTITGEFIPAKMVLLPQQDFIKKCSQQNPEAENDCKNQAEGLRGFCGL